MPQINGHTRPTGFRPGVSGNPGGRPRGLARAAREIVGDDGHQLAEFWHGVMTDEAASMRDRLEASRLLAGRGWGKVTSQVPFQDTGQPVVTPEVDRRPTRERMLELPRLAQELEMPEAAVGLEVAR